ncbi:MAG TPA: hypothetical protein VFF68_04235 [Anaerolineaceae bacterium]|nr:hypothetical protein [Anaerolineaceae bacterium]
MTQAKTTVKFSIACTLWLALFLAGMVSIYAAGHGLAVENWLLDLLGNVSFLVR